MDILTMSIFPCKGMLPCSLTHHPINTLMPSRWPDKICSPTSSPNWLAKKPLFCLKPWHFSILVPCVVRQDGGRFGNSSSGLSGATLRMELPHGTQACEFRAILRKAAGAGSSVTSSEQHPGTGVTLEASQSSYQQIQVWAPSYKASLGWILTESPVLRVWMPCLQPEPCYAVGLIWPLVYCRPQTSDILSLLLIPGKHGGPPEVQNTCCPRYPSPAHLWPQHHSLHW